MAIVNARAGGGTTPEERVTSSLVRSMQTNVRPTLPNHGCDMHQRLDSPTVHMFPGQGTQHLGMGRTVCDSSPATRAVWDCASDVSGFDVRRLCARGPMTRLSETVHQQVAVTTVNLATLTALRAASLPSPEVVIGHSVGEYSALYAAGVLDLDDTFRAVAARGRIMQAIAKRTDGAMYALLRADHAQARALLGACGVTDEVTIANDNSPAQQVISGSRRALRVVLQEAARRGLATVRLSVNGAWHSPLMAEGRAELAAVLERLEFRAPTVSVLANTDAAVVDDPAYIRQSLVTHLTATVRWRETMTELLAQGFRCFVEIGPKRVLTRLIADFTDNATTLDCPHLEDLLKALSASAKPPTSCLAGET